MTLSPSYPPASRQGTGLRRGRGSRPGVHVAPAVLVYLGAPEGRDAPDLPSLARAVERMVHSLAPDVVTRVTVAPSTEGTPAENEQAWPPDAPPGPEAAGRQSGAGPARVELADGLYLDVAGRTLEVDGDQLTLTRREFELISYLQRRRGVALSRQELMSRVWQEGHLAGDRTIDVHVRRLRMKLGRHHERIATLRGYGYRFD